MSSGRRKLCLALVLLALGVGLVSANKKSVSELDVYVKAAERAWAGESLNEPGEVKPFTYPPPFALPFLPFVPLPQWSLRSVFFLVNAGSLAAVVVLLRRRLLPVMGQADPPAPRERWLWILLLVLAGRSLASPLSNQSHDLLVFLCVALGVEASCRGRELSAGLAFAVGGGDDQGGLLVADGLQVLAGKDAMALVVVNLLDRPEGLQLLESAFDVAFGDRLDGIPVRAFLADDGRDLGWAYARFGLEQSQGVSS